MSFSVNELQNSFQEVASYLEAADPNGKRKELIKALEKYNANKTKFYSTDFSTEELIVNNFVTALEKFCNVLEEARRAGNTSRPTEAWVIEKDAFIKMYYKNATSILKKHIDKISKAADNVHKELYKVLANIKRYNTNEYRQIESILKIIRNEKGSTLTSFIDDVLKTVSATTADTMLPALPVSEHWHAFIKDIIIKQTLDDNAQIVNIRDHSNLKINNSTASAIQAATAHLKVAQTQKPDVFSSRNNFSTTINEITTIYETLAKSVQAALKPEPSKDEDPSPRPPPANPIRLRALDRAMKTAGTTGTIYAVLGFENPKTSKSTDALEIVNCAADKISRLHRPHDDTKENTEPNKIKVHAIRRDTDSIRWNDEDKDYLFPHFEEQTDERRKALVKNLHFTSRDGMEIKDAITISAELDADKKSFSKFRNEISAEGLKTADVESVKRMCIESTAAAARKAGAEEIIVFAPNAALALELAFFMRLEGFTTKFDSATQKIVDDANKAKTLDPFSQQLYDYINGKFVDKQTAFKAGLKILQNQINTISGTEYLNELSTNYQYALNKLLAAASKEPGSPPSAPPKPPVV